MPFSDKDIVITPNKGSSTLKPTIKFTDGLASSSATISLNVETINGRAAFTVEGIEGRLLTILDSFTGTIFAITDNVGIPIMEVDNTGTVLFNRYKGSISLLSTATVSQLVTGNISTSTSDLVLGASGANSVRIFTSGTNFTRFQVGPLGQLGVGGANYGTTGSVLISNGTSLAPAWSNTIGTSTFGISFASTVTFSRSYTEIVAAPAITSNILTLDLATAGIFDVSLNATINTITITNPSATGRSSSFLLILNYGATSYTVTWPASFRWPGGSAPILTNTNGKRDIFTIFTTDGGTTYNAFISGLNL